MTQKVKRRLLADLETNFSRLMGELEAMPPAMSHLGTIPAHTVGRQLSGDELIAYVLGWTELGCSWCEQVQGGEELVEPVSAISWEQCNDLAQNFYEKLRGTEEKTHRARLILVKEQLMERLQACEDEVLTRSCTPEGKTLAALLEQYLVQLYSQELLRLRKWKKGLGWV